MLNNIRNFLKGNFFRESFLAMSEQGISSVTSFLTSIILARNVDQNSVGIYTLLLSVAMIIMGLQRVFILVPFNVYYPKMDNINDKKKYAARTMGFETAFLIILAIILICFKFLGIMKVELNIISCSIFMLGYLLRDYARQFLLGINKILSSVIMGSIQSLSQMILFIILIYYNEFTLNSCMIAIGITTGIISIIFLSINTSMCISKNGLLHIWEKNKFIAKWSIGISMSESVKNQTSIWILNSFISTQSVGIYSIHNTFAMLPQPIFNGLSQYLLPHFSKIYSEKKISSVINKSIIAIIGVFLMNLIWAIILLVVGKQLIVLIYGEKYIGLTLVLLLCCIKGFFTSLTSIISSILQAIEKPQIIFRSLIIGIVILIVSGAILTLKYNIVGMCISLCISFATIAILQGIELIKIINKVRTEKKEK